MKHIKLFENNTDKVYVVIYMFGALPGTIHIFNDKKDADNFLINSIHSDIKEEEGEDYGCKEMFDVDDLIEYWNNTGSREHETGTDIYCEDVTINNNEIKLLPELQMRLDSKKYNI